MKKNKDSWDASRWAGTLQNNMELNWKLKSLMFYRYWLAWLENRLKTGTEDCSQVSEVSRWVSPSVWNNAGKQFSSKDNITVLEVMWSDNEWVFGACLYRETNEVDGKQEWRLSWQLSVQVDYGKCSVLWWQAWWMEIVTDSVTVTFYLTILTFFFLSTQLQIYISQFLLFLFKNCEFISCSSDFFFSWNPYFTSCNSVFVVVIFVCFWHGIKT